MSLDRQQAMDWRASDLASEAVLAALPAGWQHLGRSRFGALGGVAQASGCHVLAHPGVGVALVDVAPDATPNAEPRLRRSLIAAGFPASFPGYLPVTHLRVEPGGLALLQPLLESSLAAQPGLGIAWPGWVPALRRLVESDTAWRDAEGAEEAAFMPHAVAEDAAPKPSYGRLALRWGLASLALGTAFLAGLLLGARPPAELAGLGGIGVSPAEALDGPLPDTAEAPAAPTTREVRRPPPAPPPQSAAVVIPGSTVLRVPAIGGDAVHAALPAPVTAPVAVPMPVAPPPQEAAMVPEAAPQAAEAEALGAPAEANGLAALLPASVHEPVAAEVPPSPGVTTPPPPRHRVAAPRQQLKIDPACAQAVFRYQQGISLNWSEMSYVRNGCHSTVRR